MQYTQLVTPRYINIQLVTPRSRKRVEAPRCVGAIFPASLSEAAECARMLLLGIW